MKNEVVGNNKISLVTKTDVLIYDALLTKKKLCSLGISKNKKLDINVVNKRIHKIKAFGFLEEEKEEGKNQKNYSIKDKYSTKIKAIVDLFKDLIESKED